MKVVKSKCEKAWLFNVVKHKQEIAAGLACFLPGCGGCIEIVIKGVAYRLAVPQKAVESPVPVKVSNARLSLLISTSHE